MIERYQEEFPSLTFSNPEPGVLMMTLEGPGLNAVDPEKHRELGEVWLAIDRDPEVRVALLAGSGKGFSAGGSFDLIDDIRQNYDTGLRVLREARDLVLNIINCSKPIVSAIWDLRLVPDSLPVSSPMFRWLARTRGSSTGTHGSALRPGTTQPSVGHCCAAWRRPSTTC